MSEAATAVVDLDRYPVCPIPGKGVMRAAYKWALDQAKKRLNTYPKRRNIGGWMFMAYPKTMHTGSDGYIVVEAICTNFTGKP